MNHEPFRKLFIKRGRWEGNDLHLCVLCITIFQFLVFIPGNNYYVTKQIPMPFWVAGATRLCALCGKNKFLCLSVFISG
jgi:hypothetical protein